MAETEYTPFQHEPDAAPTRLIVRRVEPTPDTQLALLTDYSYHACITDREGDTSGTEGRPCRHGLENAIRDLKYGVGLNHLPSGRFACQRRLAGGAGRLARWTVRAGRRQGPQWENQFSRMERLRALPYRLGNRGSGWASACQLPCPTISPSAAAIPM